MIDYRIASRLRLVDMGETLEIQFQDGDIGKCLTLHIISKTEVTYARFDLLTKTIEEAILQLPPFDVMIGTLKEKGRDI